MNELYSYWTFGDVFEEKGVPNSLFHGGFGMVAAGNIPKPTFWIFSFYKHLKEFSEACVLRDENAIIVKSEEGYAGILWDKDDEDLDIEITLPIENDEYTIIRKTVDEECCNPLKLWHDIGEPAYPTKEQTELIKSCAFPLITSDVLKVEDGKTVVKSTVHKHGIEYFEIKKRTFTPDRGYNYEKVISTH